MFIMSSNTFYPRSHPKYIELAQIIRQQIVSGSLTPGAQIPSEPDLCQRHRLSRGTVRQAIDLLAREGLLVREQGRGTFVASVTRKSQVFSLSSFDDVIRQQLRQPSTRLLVNEQIPCSPAVATRLAIPVDTPIYHIRRLRFADDQPVALETRYLAVSLCPQLGELSNHDLETASLHWLFVHQYQIPLVRLEHVVDLQPIQAEPAALLQTPPHTTAFHIDRLTFTRDSEGQTRPAVLFQAIYSQENYAIHTQTL